MDLIKTLWTLTKTHVFFLQTLQVSTCLHHRKGGVPLHLCDPHLPGGEPPAPQHLLHRQDVDLQRVGHYREEVEGKVRRRPPGVARCVCRGASADGGV